MLLSYFRRKSAGFWMLCHKENIVILSRMNLAKIIIDIMRNLLLNKLLLTNCWQSQLINVHNEIIERLLNELR